MIAADEDGRERGRERGKRNNIWVGHIKGC